jgi:arylsulfatase A-like enzyme
MSYYTVHTPIQAKEDKIAKYRAKAQRMGLDKVKTLEEGEHFPCEHKKDQRVVRRLVQSDPVYAAMIESLDENVGRLLQTISESGQDDNTIVIFTSDNGGLATAEGSPTCNAPLAEGKGWMYEGGTREPLFIRWPGKVKAGSVTSEPVTSPDFYPTVLEAAGIENSRGQAVDGASLVSLLKGEGTPKRDAIFWHYPHYGNQGGTPGASVRSGKHKLIEFFEDNRVEVYDLENDPGEKADISDSRPKLTEQLRMKLHQWQQDVEAKIPRRNPDW